MGRTNHERRRHSRTHRRRPLRDQLRAPPRASGRTPDGDGTRLSFRSTTSLEPDFLTKVPAGWHFHFDALARHLEGGETDLVEIPDWEPIHAAYLARA
jgi:hypothetical protein